MWLAEGSFQAVAMEAWTGDMSVRLAVERFFTAKPKLDVFRITQHHNRQKKPGRIP